MASHSADAESPRTTPWVVLKVRYREEYQRLLVTGDKTLETVRALLCKVLDVPGEPVIKYDDDEGDECTLVEVTFPDFLDLIRQKAFVQNCQYPVMKLRMRADTSAESSQPASPKSSACFAEEVAFEPSPEPENNVENPQGCVDALVAPGQQDVRSKNVQAVEGADTLAVQNDLEATESDSSDSWIDLEPSRPDRDHEELHADSGLSDDADEAEALAIKNQSILACQEQHVDSGLSDDADEAEALAIKHQSILACQEIVTKHLAKWLESDPPLIRYEAWIAAVHPDNAKGGVIDSRMYLPKSYHRNTWNKNVAGVDGLTDEEREKRFVPPNCEETEEEENSDIIGSPGQSASAHGSPLIRSRRLLPPPLTLRPPSATASSRRAKSGSPAVSRTSSRTSSARSQKSGTDNEESEHRPGWFGWSHWSWGAARSANNEAQLDFWSRMQAARDRAHAHHRETHRANLEAHKCHPKSVHDAIKEQQGRDSKTRRKAMQSHKSTHRAAAAAHAKVTRAVAEAHRVRQVVM